MSTDDDEALSWAGDEPVAATPPRRPSQRVEPVETTTPHPAEPPQRVEPVETTDTSDTTDPLDDTAKHPLNPVLLVTYGILGGVYLICTIGWIVLITGDVSSVQRIEALMFRIVQIVAIAAPALWFGGVLLLARRRAVVAIPLLIAGLALTLPWPLFITGA